VINNQNHGHSMVVSVGKQQDVKHTMSLKCENQ